MADLPSLSELEVEPDSIQDLPPLDSLEVEAEATPTPNPNQSALSQAGEFVTGTVTEDIPATVKETGGMLSSLSNLLERAAVINADIDAREGYTPMVNELAGLMSAIKENFEALPPETRKAVATRMAGSTIGGVVGGLAGGAGVVPGAAAGNVIAGEINELMGWEDDTPLLTMAKAKEVRKELVQGMLVPWTLRKTGQATVAVGDKIKKASQSLDDLRKIKLAKPGALPAALTIGSKSTGSEGVLRRELARGEATFSRINPIANATTADEAIEGINAAITSRRTKKLASIKSIDDAVAAVAKGGGDAPLIAAKDLGLDDIKKEIEKQLKTGVGKESAKIKAEILDEFEEGFRQAIPQDAIDRSMGRTRTVSQPKTLADMQDVLDGTYEELRKLKLYDDLSISRADISPSEMAKNAARVEVYQVVADKIKDSMDKYVSNLASKGIISKEAVGGIKTLNQEMHDLIPYRTAFERFSDAAAQAITTDPPRSLVQRAGSEFVRPQSARSAALDVVTAPATRGLNERAALRAQIGFEPEVMDDINTAIGLRRGEIAPGRSQSALLGTAGTGVSMTGEVLQQATNPAAVGAIVGAASVARDTDFSNSVLAYDTLAQSPEFTEELEMNPDIDDEIKGKFMASKNGTAFEKLNALGQLKSAARDLGWFPPPKMQGIHSFVEIPKGKVSQRGTPILGYISDENEGEIYYDSLEEIQDVYEREDAKNAFNTQGSGRRAVTVLPPSLVSGKAKPKPPAKPTPIGEPPSASIDTGSSEGGERVVYDH